MGAEGERNHKSSVCSRFTTMYGDSWGWGNKQYRNKIAFSTNKSIWIEGICIYGPKQQGLKTSLSYFLQDAEGKSLASGKLELTSHGTDRTYECMFNKSALITAGRSYTVGMEFLVDVGGHCFYSIGGKATVLKDDVTFTFSNVAGSSTGISS